jgi:exopolyphosphatase / guanosine-5'-triphosphate,3'-diphosphate pyrophosphatase
MTDGGPEKEGATLNGSGEPDKRAEVGQPKKKRRRRRRGKNGAQSSSKTSANTPQSENGGQGHAQASASPEKVANGSASRSSEPAVYAAIDLGTNNCRLLVAKRSRDGFRVIDAYSRIVRLGEGLAHTGELSRGAMDRALEGLKICAAKMERRGVTRVRSIATEACRTAQNSPAFVSRVKSETGIALDIVSTADEAKLAVTGCAPLLDPEHAAALVFDIGGGSTELMWVRQGERPDSETKLQPTIKDWTSLPCGVVTLAEIYGGGEVSRDLFEEMVGDVSNRLGSFKDRLPQHFCGKDEYHLLGTSGTVTTIAGIHLGLERYDRSRVDGAWVNKADVSSVTDSLLSMSLSQRAAHPCVGVERADLVLAGCAILEAISRAWPAERLRVADRGLREGILFSLMEEDEANGANSGRKRRRRRRRKRNRPQAKVSQPPVI